MSSQLVRTYSFVPNALPRVVRLVELELIPALHRQPGFLGYRLITTADDRAVSESTWEMTQQAVFADAVEAEWVRDFLTNLLVALPDPFVGPVMVDFPDF